MQTIAEQRHMQDVDRKLSALRRQHDYRSHLPVTGVTKEQVMEICKKQNVVSFYSYVSYKVCDLAHATRLHVCYFAV